MATPETTAKPPVTNPPAPHDPLTGPAHPPAQPPSKVVQPPAKPSGDPFARPTGEPPWGPNKPVDPKDPCSKMSETDACDDLKLDTHYECDEALDRLNAQEPRLVAASKAAGLDARFVLDLVAHFGPEMAKMLVAMLGSKKQKSSPTAPAGAMIAGTAPEFSVARMFILRLLKKYQAEILAVMGQPSGSPVLDRLFTVLNG